MPPEPPFPYVRSSDQTPGRRAHHPLVIVGAGPVGLTLALDLARRGRPSVVLDRRRALSEGSRAICWAKRTLEIMDRLGVGDDLVAHGVTWNHGRVLDGDKEVLAFNLLPEVGHERPAFINLQQFHFEAKVLAAVTATGLVDIRWGHEVTGLAARGDGAMLEVATPDGPYAIDCDWMIGADGPRSTLRRALGLGFEGLQFNDQFLICDIKMKVDRPTERWFWFDPPFNPGRSALLHRQADDVWRLDFQIGPDADRDEETKPTNVARRVRAMLGDIDFTFEWISCYRFQCRRLARFRHGRVLFVGDAAHQVSPFGARGGNSGIQDADNLGWKLDRVMAGASPDGLLDSYDLERRQAADENILNSTRSTDFISPKSHGARLLRDAVLDLATEHTFARRMLNSGRLSLPTIYDGSPLNGPDGFAPGEAPALRPGAPMVDGDVNATDFAFDLRRSWLLRRLNNPGFTALWLGFGDFAWRIARLTAIAQDVGIPLEHVVVEGEPVHARYGAATAPALYLIRPDQHVAARFRGPIEQDIMRIALRRAAGQGLPVAVSS